MCSQDSLFLLVDILEERRSLDPSILRTCCLDPSILRTFVSVFAQLLILKFWQNILIFCCCFLLLLSSSAYFAVFLLVATVDLSCYLNIPSFSLCVLEWIVLMCFIFLHWFASEHVMYRTQFACFILWHSVWAHNVPDKIACFSLWHSVWAYNIPDTNCLFQSLTQRLGT